MERIGELMRSSFNPSDVQILMKDITGLVEPLDSEKREEFIQKGVHYCQMMPMEKAPSKEYLAAYEDALERFSEITAYACGVCGEIIYKKKQSLNETPVIVSLARAGTPVGVLVKRYIEAKYKVKVPHYSISIIRGKGIDKNAMRYILSNHSPKSIQFVDGWTGKGAIICQLNAALEEYPQVEKSLAVLSDAAHAADIYGSREDFLIPSCCLNSTVTGLISRSFLRDDIIGKNDFHGAMYWEKFENQDRTYEFINSIEEKFPNNIELTQDNFNKPNFEGIAEAKKIAEDFDINDINLVKPSIGEATRVLLRRVPWKILVHSLNDEKNLGHIYRLAKEKNVMLQEYPLKNYKACGLIKRIADS